MKNINNKYDVEKELEFEENFSNYIVRNIEENKKYALCILKNGFTYEKTRDYLLSKFNSIKNLNFENVINIINIEIIYNINGIKLDIPQYGYLMEYIENSMNLNSYLKKSKIEEKLNLFMEICASVNTLNIEGYVFDEINLRDIIIFYDAFGNMKMKLKNLLGNELRKFNFVNSFPYQYNVESIEITMFNKDNILQIINLCTQIFTKDELKNQLKELNDIKTNYNQGNNINKLFKIKYFIQSINKKMGKNYKLFMKDSLNKIKLKIDVIGMTEEMKIVEKNLQNILENKENYKFICFRGENGTGKTRLLDEIKYNIENKYLKDVIYIKKFTNSEVDKQNYYNNILESFYNNLDKNLKENYKMYIEKFVRIVTNNDIYSSKKKFQLINRMEKFMSEYALTKPFIMIIDDLDEKNEIFKLFFKYIIFFRRNIQNILIIFSVNESNINENFYNFLKELKQINQYEEYTINYLNQYNTTKMIKNMLNTNVSINGLSTKIYSETLGNPQYIRSVIIELYESKKLYFNDAIGLWKTDIRGKDILIPKSLEKKLEENILLLNFNEINVLRQLSIFKNPMSEKIIFKYLITDDEDREIYSNLKVKRFLTDKISDQGIFIGFSNNLLRNILYLKLSKEEKIRMHNKVIDFMEQIASCTDYYMEEYLFHLEKSKKYDKVYFYTLKYAQDKEEVGDNYKAIFYYKKILRYAKKIDNCKISIKIAKLYEKSLESNRSFKYFEKANQTAIKNDEMEIEIYTLLEMIIIKINSFAEMDVGIEYSLECIRRLLDKKFYSLGEIYYNYAISLKYTTECNNKLATFYAQRALLICEENEIKGDIYGWIVCILIKNYIARKNYMEAENLCWYSIKIFEDNNNISGELFVKLLYTSICKEKNVSNENVLKQYIEIAKISNQNKIYIREIISLTYIADIYNQEKKYIEAEKYLLRALEIEKEERIELYSFSICSELCLLYIKIGKTNLAVKYYNLMKQIEKNVKLSEEEIINKNYTYASYNLMICDYISAYEYLKEIYAVIYEKNAFYYKIIKCNYYELVLYKCKNEEEIKKIYSKLEEKITLLKDEQIQLEIKISAIRRILLLGYRSFAKMLFLKLKEYPKNYDFEGIYIFLELNFKDENECNTLIEKGLKLIPLIVNKEVKADLYAIIGERYIEINNNLHGMNYYYEAIILYIDAINLLPKNDKLKYANNSRFIETRYLFIECLTKVLNIDIKFKEINIINSIEELNEILKELDISNILNNKYIFKLSEEFYEEYYANNLCDIYKVFEKFSDDTINNLTNVVKYMARLVLADKAILILENNNGENDVICSYGINDKNELNKYISLKVDSEEDTFVLSNNGYEFNLINEKTINNVIRCAIYMKIISRKSYVNNIGINARLILSTNNAINYINSESKTNIDKFKPFLIFLIEKYQLTISSTLDKLTGAYNRKYFEEALLFLRDSSKSGKSEFAVIMFDIDDFKSVNDKYGHQTGDEVLIKLTRVVRKNIGEDKVISRYGGEEFIILIPNTNQEKVINIGEEIRKEVEESKILGSKRKVTISMGIAMSTYENISNEEIIRRADQALYKAKREGKNKCIIWENGCGAIGGTNNDFADSFLSGNAAKDYKTMLITRRIFNIVKSKSYMEEKAYRFILEIMQAIECDEATIFIIKEKKIIKNYSKSKNKEGWKIREKYNLKLINQAIEEEKGAYQVDWESMDNYNDYGLPEWKSICLTPIVCNGEILAVLYISVSISEKEFNCNDYNMLTYFSEISIPIFIT